MSSLFLHPHVGPTSDLCAGAFEPIFKVENPPLIDCYAILPEQRTPKSDAALGRVSPLVVAMRTASRRNSSVYLIAIPDLLQC